MKSQDLKGILRESIEDLKQINLDYLREHRLLTGSPNPAGYDVRHAEEVRHHADAYMGSDTLD